MSLHSQNSVSFHQFLFSPLFLLSIFLISYVSSASVLTFPDPILDNSNMYDSSLFNFGTMVDNRGHPNPPPGAPEIPTLKSSITNMLETADAAKPPGAMSISSLLSLANYNLPSPGSDVPISLPISPPGGTPPNVPSPGSDMPAGPILPPTGSTEISSLVSPPPGVAANGNPMDALRIFSPLAVGELEEGKIEVEVVENMGDDFVPTNEPLDFAALSSENTLTAPSLPNMIPPPSPPSSPPRPLSPTEMLESLPQDIKPSEEYIDYLEEQIASIDFLPAAMAAVGLINQPPSLSSPPSISPSVSPSFSPSPPSPSSLPRHTIASSPRSFNTQSILANTSGPAFIKQFSAQRLTEAQNTI